MRSLSPAESRVLHALLAEVEGGERERLRVAGVPRSTYHKVRAKALREGWVRERFVPDPALCGIRSVRFALGEPFVEHWEEAVGWWRQRRGTAVLWTGLGAILSVVLDAAAPDPERPVLGPPEWFRRCSEVRTEASASGVPIYFDHEGVWSRWIGAEAPVSYPIPFGRRDAPIAPTGARPIPAPRLRALRAVLAPPMNPAPASSATDAGTNATRREEAARLVQAGWVRHRTFPDFRRIPARDGARISQIVLVAGTWKRLPRPAELLLRVRGDAGALPFLYAHDRQRVLLGLHGPRVLAGPAPSISLGGALAEFLVELEVVREPIESLATLVDHDYSHVLSEPAIGEAPAAREGLGPLESRPVS